MDIPKEFLSKEFLSHFKTGEDVTAFMKDGAKRDARARGLNHGDVVGAVADRQRSFSCI